MRKKISKTKRITRSRKNPIDYDLLKNLDINIPIGIPTHPSAAYELGVLLGLEKVLKLRLSNDTISVYYLNNLKKYLKLNKEKILYLKNLRKSGLPTYIPLDIDEKLPSDALKDGLLYGIEWGFTYANDDLQRGLTFVKSLSLYQQYADTRPSNTKFSKVSKVRAYFGLDPRKK